MNKPFLEIVIVTWNNCNEIIECLRGLETRPGNWRVTVVDNNSSDGTADIVREEFPHINVVANPDNRGFAKANNQVITQTDSAFILALNPDTVANVSVIQQALDKMSILPTAGMLGVKILESDRTVHPSCQRFPSLFTVFLLSFGLHMILPTKLRADLLLADYWGYDTERPVDSVLGAFMLVRREAIDAAGAIPDQYFLYYEEVDWSYQMLQKGFETWFTPDVSIIHHGNRSGSQRSPEWRMSLMFKSRYAFCKKNYGHAKMKAIQYLDLVGLALRKLYYSWPYVSDRVTKRALTDMNLRVIREAIRSTK